jgi:microcystin degradation protein MlrC
MKILVGSFMYETNFLNTVKSDLDFIKNSGLWFDDIILDKYKNTNTELWGFLKVLNKYGVEIVPTMANSLSCGGKLTTDAYSFLKEELLKRIRTCKNLDGVLLSLHGQMITEEIEDAEGDLLEEIRLIVGPDTYIVSTVDFHADITKKMVNFADVLVGYDTAPHIDQLETGCKAAEILISLIKRKAKAFTVMIKPPMLVHGDTMVTDRDPLLGLMKKVIKVRSEKNIISSSLFASISIMDTEEAGPCVIVSSECDKKFAQEKADYLAHEFWKLREKFLIKHMPASQALDKAMKIAGGPVVIINPADSPCAGGPGDTTCALEALLDKKIKNAALATITDAEAVDACIKAGVGQEVNIKIGGKLDKINSKPLKVKGVVKIISDGKFILKGPLYTGTELNMGKAVVLRIEDIDVVITEKPVFSFDPELLRSVGIEPKDKKIVVLKEGTHFRAAYEQFAKGIFFIDCPGFTDVDFSRLVYKRIRRPIFPLDKGVKYP